MLWFELTCICHPPFAFHPLLPNLHQHRQQQQQQRQQQEEKRHQVVKSATAAAAAAEVVAAVAEASQTVINNTLAQKAKQHEGHKACCYSFNLVLRLIGQH
jgi:hypothetical protein